MSITASTAPAPAPVISRIRMPGTASELSIPMGDACLDREVGINTATVYTNMRQNESVVTPFDESARYIKHRRVLVDWMCEVGERFKLGNTTTHVAVGYMDRILQTVPVTKNRLQLVALCCLIIAAKYEEAEENVPSVGQINSITRNAFKPDMVHHMEVLILNKLNWCLTLVTPVHFLAYFVAKGVVFSTDRMLCKPLVPRVPRYMQKYVDFFADLCLQHHSFQRYLPSILAASIVVAARRALNICPVWTDDLIPVLGYSHEALDACTTHIWEHYRENFPRECAAADRAIATSEQACVQAAAPSSDHDFFSPKPRSNVPGTDTTPDAVTGL